MLNKKALSAARIASGAVTDPDFEYVTMLLHGDGTNGGQNNTFTDGSTNNFTVTRNGNTTQGTFSPYAPGWSNFFDGTDDYLSIADNANLRLGSGAFTIEAWVYRNASGAAHTIFAKGGASTGVVFQIASTNVLRFTHTTTNIDSTGTIAANTWVHVAVVREGTGTNQTKLYINGTQDGQGTVSTDFTQTEEVRIGTDRSLGADFNGYISNLRMIKGTAQYTGNFTVPTSALTAVTNTSLLTCQSNRFIDNSSNGFTITRNGDVRVQPFNPFSPAAAYSTGTNGGSGYFDGTGDWLNNTTGAIVDFGSSDYTIEYWLYLIGDATLNQYAQAVGPSTLTANGIGFGLIGRGGGANDFYATSSTTSYSTTVSCPKNTWVHVAWVRTGTSVALYRDGQLQTTLTITNNYTDLGIGIGGVIVGGTAQYYINGYISNLRVVKGSRVYTSNFTPPTAPLTAITNTSLLLNFTNGAIIDNAMDNVLETIGNAQISTSVKKFGTGSLSFDGTGDYLKLPASPEFNFGSGDFTIEFWMYKLGNQGGNRSLFTTSDGDVVTGIGIFVDDGNVNRIGYTMSSNGSSWDIALVTNAATPALNQWVHVALCRSGSSIRLFLDGTVVSTTTSSASLVFSSTATPCIGGKTGGSERSFNGYIDDLRITKGKARYTANFTPPTAAFPDL